MLLSICLSLESWIFGETEAQWHEIVLDWNQGTRDEVEVLPFAYHMALRGRGFAVSSFLLSIK